MVMVAHFSEYGKTHWVVHFKWKQCILINLSKKGRKGDRDGGRKGRRKVAVLYHHLPIRKTKLKKTES